MTQQIDNVNIKLVMDNETDRQITRSRKLSGTTQMCLNFLTPPHKNFKIQPAYIAHIAKISQTNSKTNALPMSAILPSLKEVTKKRYLYA